jgi:hypothetical protein
MKLTAHQLNSLNSPVLKYISGDLSREASSPLPPEQWTPGHLVFVSTKEDLEKLLNLKAPVPKLQKASQSVP